MSCLSRDKAVVVKRRGFKEDSGVPGLTNLGPSCQQESEEVEEAEEPPKEAPTTSK